MIAGTSSSEGRRARDALSQARRFLHGRLVTAIKLTLLAFVGQLGGNVAAVVVMIPAALVGGLVYLVAGLVPSLVTGGALAAPLVVAVMGATGAFRSSVWTLGFIGDRHPPVSPAAEALAGEGSAA